MLVDLSTRRVMVTGGSGFVGQHVVGKLRERGVRELFVPRSADYNLVDRQACRRAIEDGRPDIIIHLAAVAGGIGINMEEPGRFFFDNLMMGVQLIEEARLARIEKVVAVGTICEYPKLTAVPFDEGALWDGYPEETNAPYGLAKKMLLVQAQAYRQQYGFTVIHPLPVNLYGPGDNFDPRTSHVIPALVKKFIEARDLGAPSVAVWGDGTASREFLYVDDAAEGLILMTERYNDSEPVNLGSGQEITIRDLAFLIAELSGYQGRIEFDPSRPNGQPRRCLDVSRAEREFGFRATTDFRAGLRETIAWYERQRQAVGVTGPDTVDVRLSGGVGS
jgi:GDP-L-fucose synthase